MFDELAGDQETLREKIHKFFFNRPSNPRTLKSLAILFLFGISILGFSTVVSSDAIGSLINPPPQHGDPFTLLWHDTGSFTTNSGFSCISVLNCHAISGAAKLQLVPGGQQASVALSKSSIDLSTLSAKEALFEFTWLLSSTAYTVGDTFGWFLTTNATLPTQNGYDPINDVSVAMYDRVLTTNIADTFSNDLFIQRDLGFSTLAQKSLNACNPAGSDYMCGNIVTTHSVSGLGIDEYTFLNFTGAGSATAPCNSTVSGGLLLNLIGPGCSWKAVTDDQAPSTNVTSVKVFPPLNFQAQQYYLGFYAQANLFPSGTDGVFWFFDNTSSNLGLGNVAGLPTTQVMGIYVFIPSLLSSTPAPLDTGGLFGPIIKALISIGVFIVANIINFFVYIFGLVSGVIVAVLNAIGNFFGLGALGTDLSNFFTGVFNWLSNILTNAFGQIGNLVNGFTQLLSALGAVFNGVIWSNIVAFVTLLSSGWTTILTVWNDLLALNGAGILGMNYFFLFDWVYGMFQLARKGMEGFKHWLDLNQLLFVNLGKAMYWFAKESFTIMVAIKQLVWPT